MKNLLHCFNKQLIIAICLLSAFVTTGCHSSLAYNAKGFGVNQSKLREHINSQPATKIIRSELPSIPSEYCATEKEVQEAQSMRLKIYKSTLELASDNFEKTKEAIHSETTKLKRYIQKMDSDYVITRIPADKFNQAIKNFCKLGRVIAKKIELEDITENTIDYQAKLKALEAQKKRLQELMNKITKVDEILKCENEITRIQNRIEEIKLRMRRVKNEVIYSTIRIWLHKKVIIVSPLPKGFKIPNSANWTNHLGLENLLN